MKSATLKYNPLIPTDMLHYKIGTKSVTRHIINFNSMYPQQVEFTLDFIQRVKFPI